VAAGTAEDVGSKIPVGHGASHLTGGRRPRVVTISAELEARGFLNEYGRPFAATVARDASPQPGKHGGSTNAELRAGLTETLVIEVERHETSSFP
jgi:hypothetical protein